MYRAQIGARTADGVASHGSLDAYITNFHACSKAFEMFVADRLTARASERQFLLWEDLDAATKEAHGLTKADAGVDVTDGTTTLVQCKLRARYLTWRECATFFASAVSFADGAYIVPWQSLLLARNACCQLSRTLAELGSSRPFDFPVHLSEFRAYAQECLAQHTPPRASARASRLPGRGDRVVRQGDDGPGVRCASDGVREEPRYGARRREKRVSRAHLRAARRAARAVPRGPFGERVRGSRRRRRS